MLTASDRHDIIQEMCLGTRSGGRQEKGWRVQIIQRVQEQFVSQLPGGQWASPVTGDVISVTLIRDNVVTGDSQCHVARRGILQQLLHPLHGLEDPHSGQLQTEAPAFRLWGSLTQSPLCSQPPNLRSSHLRCRVSEDENCFNHWRNGEKMIPIL